MMAKSGVAGERLELLDGPCGRPWGDLENQIFITISTVLSSWAPPGFSCPYFINCMEITVFIDIVTPNGLLNFMIF